ncbi:MAG: primosomal protein N' [Dehalococcoidia bacterium]|nr:primosomal protein N' [Dehalococcoidia bacterium]
MGYAEVAVNSPVAQRRTFSYSIPPSLSLSVGHAVWVPFGNRVLQGVVCRLTEHPEVAETKEVISTIGTHPLLTPTQVELARWISGYYLAPLFDALALMLPPGFERKLLAFYELAPGFSPSSAASLSPEQSRLVAVLERDGRTAQAVLEKALGKKKARRALEVLLEKGVVIRSEALQKPRTRPKTVPHVGLAVGAAVARAEAERLAARAPRQAALLRLLLERAQPVPARETAATPATVKALRDRGLISIVGVQVWRDPLLDREFVPSAPPVLTASQEAALEEIRAGLKQLQKGSPPAVFLLHGVTGSGKTEIYMHALAEAVVLGRRGIVLVPEISLTPQTIGRFASRFPGRVAVLHSRMSPGEQFDEWHRIRDGAFDVVIGPRSALFAPQPDLGLIIIDEEHEWTYKQEEQSPRYHAREVALKLGELAGAAVVLGSATPDVETYYGAQTGRLRLLELPQRITVRGESPLPEVELVDMREELKAGNRSIFSRSLSRAIGETLDLREQVILFLNRRGSSTFVQCRNCGYAMRCPRCDLALTYHSRAEMLSCHQCNYRKAVPDVCPVCWSRRIRYLGLGTERVEDEVRRAFPLARTLRWDRDVTGGKGSHEKILDAFLAHKADILIGTQMIAKGLDLPLVTLVGIISADTMLHFPDIRASERTFQLLSQVAGRAGRGALPGKVVVQTYTPDNYAIAAGARHDYASFYRREIELRQQHNQPPFGRLISLVHMHANAEACRAGAEKMFQRLSERRDQDRLNVELVGPAPMFFARIRGRYRWQIVLRGPDPARLLEDVTIPQGWIVNVDPMTLL